MFFRALPRGYQVKHVLAIGGLSIILAGLTGQLDTEGLEYGFLFCWVQNQAKLADAQNQAKYVDPQNQTNLLMLFL
jgi:hypothetical protein